MWRFTIRIKIIYIECMPVNLSITLLHYNRYRIIFIFAIIQAQSLYLFGHSQISSIRSCRNRFWSKVYIIQQISNRFAITCSAACINCNKEKCCQILIFSNCISSRIMIPCIRFMFSKTSPILFVLVVTGLHLNKITIFFAAFFDLIQNSAYRIGIFRSICQSFNILLCTGWRHNHKRHRVTRSTCPLILHFPWQMCKIPIQCRTWHSHDFLIQSTIGFTV